MILKRRINVRYNRISELKIKKKKTVIVLVLCFMIENNVVFSCFKVTVRCLAVIFAAFVVCTNGDKPFYASSSRYPHVQAQSVPNSKTDSAASTECLCERDTDSDDGKEPATSDDGNAPDRRPDADHAILDNTDSLYQRQRRIQMEIDRLTDVLSRLQRNAAREQQQVRRDFPSPPLQRGALRPIVVAKLK